MIFLCPTPSPASALLDRVIAVVNKEVITWSELYRAMEFEATADMKALKEEDRKRIFKENEASFLDMMIDRKLQVQAAKKLDIDATKEEITDTIEGIKKKYSMGENEFQESLKKEGFTLEEYRKRLAEQIILSKVVGKEVRSRIVISPEEVTAYLAKNRDAGYRVRQVFFKKDEKDPDGKALEARAAEVMLKLKEGEDFSSLAQRYSEDPSARSGGDLGYIKKEFLAKGFLDVISEMNAGDVSKPFWTEKGLHILKLEEKGDIKNEEELREAAKKRLFEQRFNEDYKNWIRSLREKAFIEVRL
jgi:peptidyl-prolyl cis-trans isomerase SurA